MVVLGGVVCVLVVRWRWGYGGGGGVGGVILPAWIFGRCKKQKMECRK